MVGGPVHEKFPPGLPTLYAVLWLVGGTLERTVWLVYCCTVGALAGAAALLWHYSRRVLGNDRLTTLLLAVLPLVLMRSMRYFSGAASEPWFILCWAAALVLTHRAAGEAARGRIAAAVALGLVLAGAGFVRTQGVVLIPAVVLALLVRRAGWRVVGATLAAALAPLLAWRVALARMVAIGPVATQPDQVSYSTWIPHGSVGAFADFVRQVLRVNGPGYAGTTVEVLVGWYSPKVALLLVGVLALAVAGMVRAGARRPELWTTLGVNMAVRRNAFVRTGPWDNRFGRQGNTLRGQEQREWCIRARAVGLRGFYAPDVIVHHIVPAERLTKRYFRRWLYWNGISRAVLYQSMKLDMESPDDSTLDFSKVPHIAGMPRYMYRSALRSLAGMGTAISRRDAAAAFEHELKLWFFAGALGQRWRTVIHRRAPG
jgi:hypothetical protein